MIQLEDFDPSLKNRWWLEGTNISSNIYVIDGGKMLIDTGNFEGPPSQLDEEIDISKIEKIIPTRQEPRQNGGQGLDRSGKGARGIARAPLPCEISKGAFARKRDTPISGSPLSHSAADPI